MTLYMDRAAEAELALLNGFGHRESKRSTTRFVALCVAVMLIGGLSVFAFVFSHRHASTQASPVQRLDKLGSYTGSIRLFEVQQQLSAQDASTLIRATNLASQHIIAELGDAGVQGTDVLKNLTSYKSFLVVVSGQGRPSRRAADQPFLTVTPSSLFPVGAINTAAETVEGVLTRRLFPLQFLATDFVKASPGPPYAVYDIAAGKVWLDRKVAEPLLRPTYVQQLITSTGAQLAKHMSDALGRDSISSVEALLAAMTVAFGLAVSASFASMVPMWFCLACPVVLGLAVPLLINLSLGALASEACKQLALPDEECLDLWVGAIFVGFVLTMAASIPIFKVCKLYQCEHQGPPAMPRNS